jgi:phosphotransferase system HPr (HPr) family protein
VCGIPVKKAEKEITIRTRRGLHAKLARLFVQATSWFSSDIWIVKSGMEVDGKTVLGLMVLGARRGPDVGAGYELFGKWLGLERNPRTKSK